MGRKHKFVSLDRILSKLYRDLGLDEVSEADVIEWSGEALEFLGHVSHYEQAVASLIVKNHQAEMPDGLHSIVQIVKYNGYEPKKPCPVEQIEEEVLPDMCLTCCKELPEIRHFADGEFVTPYGDNVDFRIVFGGQFYQREFTPVRLSNHTFFNTIVCPEMPDIYKNCEEEYTVVDNVLKFSFQEGQVLLSYYRQKMDPDTGYPMVPDDVSIINAITYYVTWKYMQRLWYMGREGYGDKMKYSMELWYQYCRQANTQSKMLYGVDEHQNFLEGQYSLIPNLGKYYGFFGKLGYSSKLKGM